MSMGAAWKARRVIENVRNVLAIELLCAAQGLDFRLPLKPGKGALDGHQKVRKLVTALDTDRVLTNDIETISSAIAAGEFNGAGND
jgi:histidine ammonia-lyase